MSRKTFRPSITSQSRSRTWKTWTRVSKKWSRPKSSAITNAKNAKNEASPSEIYWKPSQTCWCSIWSASLSACRPFNKLRSTRGSSSRRNWTWSPTPWRGRNGVSSTNRSRKTRRKMLSNRVVKIRICLLRWWKSSEVTPKTQSWMRRPIWSTPSNFTPISWRVCASTRGVVVVGTITRTSRLRTENRMREAPGSSSMTPMWGSLSTRIWSQSALVERTQIVRIQDGTLLDLEATQIQVPTCSSMSETTKPLCSSQYLTSLKRNSSKRLWTSMLINS